MNSFLKNLGLVVSFATGNVNYNGPLITGMSLIIVGIIAYIVLNKVFTE